MGLGGWLQEQLFERRIVMLTGRLDADAASRAAAVLTALDADGARAGRPRRSPRTCGEGATWTLSRPSPTGSSTRWFDKGEDASLASAKAFTRRPLRTPGGTTWARSSAWA
jgi:hypothetical protein